MAKSITSLAPAESLQTLLEREAAPFSTEESVALLVALAEQVDALHDSGKLHRAISAESVVLDSSSTGVLLLPGPAEPVLLGGPAADQGQTPPELDRTEAVLVPADLDSARQLLARRGINFDPVRIDLYQLGTLLVRLVAGESASDYLRSPRAKRKVSPAVRPLIDGALGYEPEKRFASVIQLSEAAGTVLARLLETAAKPTAAMAPDTDGASGQSSKQDTDLSIVAEATSDTSMAPPRRAETGRSDLPFRRLAHYEILERIGRGGMGDVFKGYERVLDRTVAIKVLPDELSRQDDFVRRFHAEASAAARMIHPNIIQIHFIGEEAGHHFFAMQYIDGESLAELLARRRKLSVEETLAIVEQALSGLAAAHRMGMVHRDIKPGNILLDRENRRALLADFGLVKSVEQDGGGITATGVVMGTVDYIAPEQGRGHSVDSRADLYSVGVLTYQMLSGRLPFTADSPTAMIFQHVYERPPALVDVAADVPAELSAIVARLLAKSPDERYQTAEAVLDDLRAFREGRPLAHGQESADEQPGTAQGTVIIEAPRFDDVLLPPSLAAATAPNWWDDAKERFLSIFQRHAPEFLKELQSTGQQIDGALREYERRRDHLHELIAEADAVLSELEAQATSYREAAEVAAQGAQSATSETAAADYRREKFDCEQMVAELEGLIAQQRDQTEQMQLRLAQVSGRLEQLRSQRDILNARLRAAQAQLRMAGGKTVSRRGWIAAVAMSAGLGLLLCLALIPFGAAIGGFPAIAVMFLILCVAVGLPLALYMHSAQRPVGLAVVVSLMFAGGGIAALIVSRGGPAESPVPISFDASGEFAPLPGLNDHTEFHLSGGPPGLARTFSGHEDEVRDIAFSPNGRYIASASWDGTARVWDARTGEEVRRFKGFRETRTVAFSPDGTRLLHAGEDAYVFVKDLQSGKELAGLLIEDVREGHRNWPIWSAAFSPDGRRVVTGDGIGNVRLWDVEARRLLWSVTLHDPKQGPIHSVEFSPGGRRILVAGGEDKTVWLLMAESGRAVKEFKDFNLGVLAAAFSPDGKYVLTGGHEWAPRLIDEREHKEVRRLIGHRRSTYTVVFSHDGRLATTAGFGGIVRVWDVETGKQVCQFSGHEDKVWSIAFSPDDRFVVSGSADRTVRLWRLPDAISGSADHMPGGPPGQVRQFNLQPGFEGIPAGLTFLREGRRVVGTTGKALRLWDISTSRLLGETEIGEAGGRMAVSPDGRTIVTADKEQLSLWDIGSFERIRRFETKHTELVHDLAFSPDGRLVASASHDGSAILWDPDTGQAVHQLDPPADKVHDVAFTPDSRRVLTTDSRGTVYFFDVDSGEAIRNLKVYESAQITAMAVSPDGRRALFSSYGGTIDLWDLVESRRLGQFRGHEAGVRCLAFSPDGRQAASGSEDHDVRLWNVETGRELYVFRGHRDIVREVCFSPDGRLLASASGGDKRATGRLDAGDDHTVRVWRLPSDGETPDGPLRIVSDAPAHQVRSFAAHTGAALAVAFSPDGRQVASGGDDGALRLWDRATGERLFDLAGHTGSVTDVAFSPDGARLVSVGADQTIRVWSTVSGAEIEKLEVPNEVRSVTWFPDRSKELFATAGRDKVVRLWDGIWWNTGEKIREFEGHGAAVNAVAYSPDGTRLASGSWDQSVIVWNTNTGNQIHRLWGTDDGVLAVAFSPDGQLLASGGADGAARLWSLETGQELRRFEGHTEAVTSVDFSADGRYLITGASRVEDAEKPHGTTVRIWDVESGRELLQLDSGMNGIASVEFSPSGLQAVSADWNGHVRLWDVGAALRESGHLTKAADENRTVAQSAGTQDKPTPHGPSVTRNGGTVTYDLGLLERADAPKDYSVYVPRNAEKVEVGFYLGGYEKFTSLNAGFKSWLAINTDTVLKWRGYEKREEGPTVYFFDNKLTGEKFSSDQASGEWLDVTSTTHPGENIFRYFHYQQPGRGMRVRIHLGENASQPGTTLAGIDSLLHFGNSTVAHDLSASPDGSSVLVAGGPVVYLVEPQTERIVQEFWGHVGNVRSVALSHDGQRVASGGDDYTIRIWDARTGQELKKLEGHLWPVLTLDFSPDSRQLLSGSDGLRLWDLETGEQLQEIRIPDQKETVWTTSFFSDGRRALTGSWDGTVRVWNLETGEELKTLAGHTGRVKSVGLSPDERLAVSCATEDPVIRLWDLEKGEVIRTFEGHRAGVASVAFSPDGKWLLSGGGLQQPANGGFLDIDPRHIRLWNVSTGEMLRELGSHGSSVVDIAFVGDGGQAVSCGAEGTVQIWTLPTATEQ